MGKIVGNLWLAIGLGMLVWIVSFPVSLVLYDKAYAERFKQEYFEMNPNAEVAPNIQYEPWDAAYERKCWFNFIQAEIMIPLGILFSLLYLKSLTKEKMWEGLKVGLIWIGIYYIFDFLVFSILLGEIMTLDWYLQTSATLYLFMPRILVFEGFLLDRFYIRQ
jgi:hypothetical protein